MVKKKKVPGLVNRVSAGCSYLRAEGFSCTVAWAHKNLYPDLQLEKILNRIRIKLMWIQNPACELTAY